MNANLTHEERERIAYIEGDAQLAELLDSAACVDAGWLSPEEADDLRKNAEKADAEACEAEGEADTLRSDLEDARERITFLSDALHLVIAQSVGDDWTAEQALAWVRDLARSTLEATA